MKTTKYICKACDGCPCVLEASSESDTAFEPKICPFANSEDQVFSARWEEM